MKSTFILSFNTLIYLTHLEVLYKIKVSSSELTLERHEASCSDYIEVARGLRAFDSYLTKLILNC